MTYYSFPYEIKMGQLNHKYVDSVNLNYIKTLGNDCSIKVINFKNNVLNMLVQHSNK